MTNIVRFCIQNPMVTFVVVVFGILFGLLGLANMPYQLMPQVTRPTISIYTAFPGATPYEVEKEIINRQEKYLKGIEGLDSIVSTARQGRAVVGLEFKAGVDINFALLKVSAKMDEIKGYPSEIDKPTIAISGENIPPAIYLFLTATPDNENEVDTYKTFFEDQVLQHLERVEGVGEVSYPGGRSNEMQILLDHKKLAFNGIRVSEVIDAVRNHNKNTTAGSLEFGMRSYKIKVQSEYDSRHSILNTPIKSVGNKIIYLKDLAEVVQGYARQNSYAYLNDTRSLSVQIIPVADANILELSVKMRAAVENLNSGILKENGLQLVWSRDQEGYIRNAISIVKENIFIGIALACIVLFLFLRNFHSMLVVLICIPICVLSSFIFLNALGRSLNVISLAGVSFAMSMLIDNAIVVVENISRHLAKARLDSENLESKFKKQMQAFLDGVREVVGAIFASVITTIAIFLPIMSMGQDIGQLFYDIALSVCFGLGISFFVSLFVIPSMLYLFNQKFGLNKNSESKDAFSNFLVSIGEKFQNLIQNILNALLDFKRSLIFIIAFVIISVVASIALMPNLDYLPKGNQNFIIAYINAPPGISYEQRKEIGRSIFEQNKHLISSLGYEQKSKDDLPPIKHLFFTSSDTYIQAGIISDNAQEIRRLIPQLRKSIDNIPDLKASIVQQGIFDKGTSTQSIYINVVGSDMERIINSSAILSQAIKDKMPYLQVRELPALEYTQREIVLYPNYVALQLNGFNARSFGEIVDVILDGKTIDEYKTDSGKAIDLVLKALPNLSAENIEKARNSQDFQTPEDISQTQIFTPLGKIIPLSSLADVRQEYSMSQIRHFERERTILLVINPPADTPLESVINGLKDSVISPLKESGELDGVRLIFGGAAKDIDNSSNDLYFGFALALIITYLILCALYGNFSYAFVIIFSVPFAIAGGLMGLNFVNFAIAQQNLDMLSLLGFIILVGSVVNNAILIVYQTKFNLSYGLAVLDSVKQATISRVRPIFMSILTSVFGLLPLVIFGGDGSEIYRGLGSVLIGGLLFSGILSIFVIPSALVVLFRLQKKI